MLTRTLSAIVFVGVFLALCFAGLLSFAIGVTILAGIAAFEMIAVYRTDPTTQSPNYPITHQPNAFNFIFLLFAACIPFLTYLGQIREREAPRGDISGTLESILRVVLVVVLVSDGFIVVVLDSTVAGLAVVVVVVLVVVFVSTVACLEVAFVLLSVAEVLALVSLLTGAVLFTAGFVAGFATIPSVLLLLFKKAGSVIVKSGLSTLNSTLLFFTSSNLDFILTITSLSGRH